ncbi:MAG: sulfatase, partial [Proteobacteria bacterium]|nr:sulfatase [Pseudomonadota bacterium]
MNSILRSLSLVFLMCLPLSCTCNESSPVKSEPSTTEVPKAAKNILFISLDTVRADHLSVYGYHLPTSPNLEALADHATLYRRAQASAPWTLPSHASMFTGLYPFEHGAHTPEPGGKNKAVVLNQDLTTIAEVLSSNGYVTGAIVANAAFLGKKFALDQGFAEYEIKRGTGDEINKRALTWLRKNKDQSFFLFLNYMDAHRPYN